MAAKTELNCIKRDVCVFCNGDNKSSLCKNCGHYIKEGVREQTNNSKSTQCTCDYDGDKNKVVVYCGKCGGIVE